MCQKECKRSNVLIVGPRQKWKCSNYFGTNIKEKCSDYEGVSITHVYLLTLLNFLVENINKYVSYDIFFCKNYNISPHSLITRPTRSTGEWRMDGCWRGLITMRVMDGCGSSKWMRVKLYPPWTQSIPSLILRSNTESIRSVSLCAKKSVRRTYARGEFSMCIRQLQ